jgi:hypothetical protein
MLIDCMMPVPSVENPEGISPFSPAVVSRAQRNYPGEKSAIQ